MISLALARGDGSQKRWKSADGEKGVTQTSEAVRSAPSLGRNPKDDECGHISGLPTYRELRLSSVDAPLSVWWQPLSTNKPAIRTDEMIRITDDSTLI
jgi:hypothetical protein